MTWYPQDFTKIPMSDMRMRPDHESGYPGRTYRFYEGEKVFEFGYGLSYSNYTYKFTSISQSKLNLKTSSPTENSKLEEKLGFVRVSDIGLDSCHKARFSALVSVVNEGSMVGKHPVLLFFRRGQGRFDGPIKQLVGFRTVRLEGNEREDVEFEVDPCEHFASADEDGAMVIELGLHFLVVGDQEFSITINV